VKSIPVPTDLNTVFNLVNNWLKPRALARGRYASTYTTKVDHVEKKKEDKNGEKGKNHQAKHAASGQPKGGAQDGEKKQLSKRLECFICGDDHYANACPHCQAITAGKKQDDGGQDDSAFVNAVWEANAFHTV
jgi:hypothetical protein